MKELRYSERTLFLLDVRPGTLSVIPDEFDRIKRSSAYRFLCVLGGECRLFLSGASYRLEKNDLCFFRPGDIYKTVPVKDMQVLNLYFSFDREEKMPEVLNGETDSILSVQRYDIADCPCFNEPFVIKDFPQGTAIAQEIMREFRENEPFAAKKQELLLGFLALDAVRYFESMREKNSTVGDILAYIRRHIKEKLTCRELAEHFSYHPNYLNQMIEHETGVSLHRYILEEKVRFATEELMTTDMTVADIAQEYAFYDSSHFAASYARVTGLRPSDIRRTAKEPERKNGNTRI